MRRSSDSRWLSSISLQLPSHAKPVFLQLTALVEHHMIERVISSAPNESGSWQSYLQYRTTSVTAPAAANRCRCSPTVGVNARRAGRAASSTSAPSPSEWAALWCAITKCCLFGAGKTPARGVGPFRGATSSRTSPSRKQWCANSRGNQRPHGSTRRAGGTQQSHSTR